MQAYVQRQMHPVEPPGGVEPVFFAAVPEPPREWRSPWLAKSLLQQAGDPSWDKREPEAEKKDGLEAYLKDALVELAIVTEIHRLVLPHGRPLADTFGSLVSFFQSRVKTVPLVIVGDQEKVFQLLCFDTRFIRRFSRSRLPGEPEEPEDQEGAAQLRRMLRSGRAAQG